MKYKNGFTLIEVAVTVAIIGVLATLTIVTFTNQQTKARDSVRSSKATIIADSLEKYYTEHHEYPSVRAMLNTYGDNTGDAVASRLSLNEKSILVMPQAASGVSNSLVGSLDSSDSIAYTAKSTIGNDNCQTSAQGGCDEFTLSYKKESDGSIVTIESNRKAKVDNPDTPLKAPTKPTVTASQSGTNFIVTSSTPSCSTTLGTTPRYAFRSQVGAGAWSAWTSWQTANNITQPAGVNAQSYSYQVHVRCESGTFMSDTSVDSDSLSVTYYTQPAVPAVPTVTIALSGSNVIGTSSEVTCDIGTVQYKIDYRTNDGTWVGGAWTTATTLSVTANDGVKYGMRTAARCVNVTRTAASAVSAEVTYIDPITTPGLPTISGSGATWSLTPASCPAGTSASFTYRFTYNATSGFSGAWTLGSWIETSGTSLTNSAATSQGVKYGIDIKQRCYNANTTSDWGAQNGGATYIVPVRHAAVSHWSSMIISGGYPKVLIKTYEGANDNNDGVCASGLTRQSRLKIKWYTTTWEGPFAWFTATEGYTQTFTTNTLLTDTDTAEFETQTRCVNGTTVYATDVDGNGYIGSPYDIGNLINSSGKYLISCKTATGYKSYCAGGYDTGGTKHSTSTSILNCAERSTGIDTLNIRNTARFTFGSASPCWSA